MKKLLAAAGLVIALAGTSSAEIAFGGTDTTDVDNWTTSSVAFDDTVQSGHSLNWENVTVNTATIDSTNNEFDLSWQAGANYTIGHMFIYNSGVDLATLTGGIEGLTMTANFESAFNPNWSPVVAVTDAGATTYYRWNHSGNSWRGNGDLDFSNGGTFDLSQLGNAPNSATMIWGELNSTATGFGGTRDNATNPNLQAATGVVQFGFIQWGASTGGNISTQTDFSTVIDSFEVVVNPDPIVVVAPTIINTVPVIGITAVSATVGGEVIDTGGENPSVTVYYGETDGGTDEFAWDDFVDLGAAGSTFSTVLDFLTPNTTYFFRCWGFNSVGEDWADVTDSFTTLTPSAPTVVASSGSVDSASTGSIGGEVTDTGAEEPNVTLYYGTTDGGEDPFDWDDSIDVGSQSGTFSANLSGLAGGTIYFYRAFAQNSAGSDWSDTAETITTLPAEGVTASVNSANFDYKYEMDVNPSTQDLDAAGSASDFFLNPALGSGVDQTMWTPQTYAAGVATSNQAGVDPEFTPEALFRTDYGGSISRQSISGNFTVEVAVNLAAGTIVAPGFDLGGFGLFINPPARDSLWLTVNETEATIGALGESPVATGSNTDAFHTFRVAYVENDRSYWVWRDDVLIYGGMTAPGGGIPGTSASVYAGGGFLIGDFAFEISGDWDIDYIRLHNEAAGPGVAVGGTVVLTEVDKAGDDVTLTWTVDPPQSVNIQKSADGENFSTIATGVAGTSFVDPNGTDPLALYQIVIP